MFLAKINAKTAEQEIDDLFHKNKSGPEDELFTLGDIKGFGMDDSIILSKMIGANIKHLGLTGSKAKEYRDKVMKVLYGED